MLKLSRKSGQRIILFGGAVSIEIESCTSNSVKLAIKAPPEISVDREEVFERKKAEFSKTE